MLRCTANRNELCTELLRRLGLELVEWQPGREETSVAAIGLGAGIVMAACDHLVKVYPGRRIVGMDLPGSLGFDARISAIDIAASTYPTLLILWSSIAPASRYAAVLAERGFAQASLMVYLKGIGSEREPWEALGAVVIDDLWSSEPLCEMQGMSIPETSGPGW